MKFEVDEFGYYGQFGGAYIPEMLYPNVEELREKYLSIMYEKDFQEEFHRRLWRLERIPIKFEHTLHGERNSCIRAG